MRLFLNILFGSVLAFQLVSCSSVISEQNYPKAYTAAILDAQNPEPDEVSDKLVSISSKNSSLIRKKIKDESYVLMVSYTGASYYKGSIGDAYDMDGYFLWVTAAPQLKGDSRVKALKGDFLKSRLNQLFGLPPLTDQEKEGGPQERSIVELWVKPQDMFRPAADFEIDDKKAGLNMPENAPAWYRKWFNDLRAKQYYQSVVPQKDAYPWTQLGYTYDWGGTKTDVGLSEFVIKGNSTVYISKIYSTDDYFTSSMDNISKK